MTRRRLIPLATLLVALLVTTSCSAIAGIFKAGVWVGFLAAVLLVVVVLIVFGRLKR